MRTKAAGTACPTTGATIQTRRLDPKLTSDFWPWTTRFSRFGRRIAWLIGKDGFTLVAVAGRLAAFKVPSVVDVRGYFVRTADAAGAIVAG